uniref:Pterin-binding domain-containing protein n=1 Tax=Rhodosorus marinus TaxID=101924 RepID=A0A7S0G4V2_9RHOD|mmetsp:Transcript_19409/g.28155  ORF Transcript_19409/g.28155 Transcript_19409/m.28155 type:complete len:441 (+) Transcript_19409:317-1639(+)
MSARILVGLGSNQGDRVGNFRKALNEMADFALVKKTSFIYKSKAMYEENQPDFYNAVCWIHTQLRPPDLLRKLKDVEESLGRDLYAPANSPRPIDLDILYYGSTRVKNRLFDLRTLFIPHPGIPERPFVLRPLKDLDEAVPAFADTASKGVTFWLDRHRQRDPLWANCPRVASIPKRDLELVWDNRTYSMGIINATPDSFSDGGVHTDVESALARAEEFVAAGCNILDVGGQSTRPGAEEIDPDAESKRVLPIIRAIRQRFPKVAISIDTFWSVVADRAVRAGADIVNDTTAGKRDPDMFETVKTLGVPYVLMHTRGNPSNMMSLATYRRDETLHSQVATELRESINDAMESGIPRWDIIADPGFGFAKDSAHNLELLKTLDLFKDKLRGFPVLTGTSRKAFIGKILNDASPIDRDFGTAAAVRPSSNQVLQVAGASIVN